MDGLSSGQGFPFVLSAYRDFEYARQAFHYGANDYLLKPISQEKLMTALEKANVKIEEQNFLRQGSMQTLLQERQIALFNFLQNEL